MITEILFVISGGSFVVGALMIMAIMNTLLAIFYKGE